MAAAQDKSNQPGARVTNQEDKMISKYCSECQQHIEVQKFNDTCPVCFYTKRMRKTETGMIAVIVVMLGILIWMSI
jgi:Zn finger protein HypA/HybF involved in hydrogenase expression